MERCIKSALCNLSPSHSGILVLHSATGWSIFGTKKLMLIFEFSSYDGFLHPKSPILRIFDDFSKKNGQNGDYLSLKLLKIIKISKNIPFLSAKIYHLVALCTPCFFA